jgi:hypothetical protein
VKALKDLLVHDMVHQIGIRIMPLWELRRRIGDVLQGGKLPAVVQQVVNRAKSCHIYQLRNLHCVVLKLEIQRVPKYML